MDFNNHYEEFELYENCANVGQQLAFGCMEYVDYDKVCSLPSFYHHHFINQLYKQSLLIIGLFGL